MTFYWWSHWFWITLLSNILLPIVIVHTYPSQDIATEYNNNNKNLKSVTKIYQTTTTVIWATTLPPKHMEAEDAADQETTKLQNIPSTMEQTAAYEEGDQEAAASDRIGSDEYEFKRSTDEFKSNKTQDAIDALLPQEDRPHDRQSKTVPKVSDEATEHVVEAAARVAGEVKQVNDFSVNNNYSNFSEIATSTNETANTAAAVQPSTVESSVSLPSSSTPAQPQIENAARSSIEWLNSRTQPASDERDVSHVVGHKVPFTLENVNKEDEILRAENEHRSRKSKVLSAEYKHINRFINYSTDSKNLLTRSASSAPNEYDADEGNISSEALAIQRTYFLDASAISAICFTVFGICCTVGTIGIVLYRRRFLNKPQALSEPDSSVYIDDSTMRVSDNSDEMYSLDNDSFLNSLEAMTIQNYWTDTVKHTKL